MISFGKVIELAQNKYYVIVVAADGFNSDEPDIGAVSVTEEVFVYGRQLLGKEK
ncbi:MAG: hypothetical protein K2N26_03695 [Oscillospiraceae bacterium]|nr:hypothetical protein [Oscillospiraceae bacterium]